MNVNDVKEKPNLKNENYFNFIFNHQKSLMATYHRIEEKSGIGYALVKGVSFNINDKRWQYLFKDFSWRVVEEVGEALEAYFLSQITENDESRQKHFIHVIEEFIDGLHFFTELLIISGVDTAGKIGDILGAPESLLDPISLFWRENFQTTLSDLSTQCMKSIQFLGMAMNCLKQKPWKQTEMLTDEMKYKKLLVRSFWFYIGIFRVLEIDPETIATYYYSKNAVNQFRQRSQY